MVPELSGAMCKVRKHNLLVRNAARPPDVLPDLLLDVGKDRSCAVYRPTVRVAIHAEINGLSEKHRLSDPSRRSEGTQTHHAHRHTCEYGLNVKSQVSGVRGLTTI